MVRVKLVGCNFNKPSVKPAEDDIVNIKLERNNEFDKNAIAVFNSLNEKIGYIGTNKTVSDGNRKNGCIDNLQLKELLSDKNTDHCKGFINKFRDYFGFIVVDI